MHDHDRLLLVIQLLFKLLWSYFYFTKLILFLLILLILPSVIFMVTLVIVTALSAHTKSRVTLGFLFYDITECNWIMNNGFSNRWYLHLELPNKLVWYVVIFLHELECT